jgi:hypothetical protein
MRAAEKRPVAHVVHEDEGATAHCLNCDGKFTLVLPCVLSVWCAAMKEFCRVHRNCKKRAAKP